MIRRGEIYFVSLDPTIGREQAGRRPVLVLFVDEINRLPLVVAVVAGTSGRNIPASNIETEACSKSEANPGRVPSVRLASAPSPA